MFSMITFAPSVAFRFLHILVPKFSEDAIVLSSMGIAFRMLSSLIVSVCSSTIKMRYGPSAFDIDLMYVGLSVVLKLAVLIRSDGLSKSTNCLVSHTSVMRTRL